MKLIVCVDKLDGMMFFGKRQSQDSVLRERVMKLICGEKLWMTAYTAKQFADCEGCIADECAFEKADEGWYFVEDGPFDIEKCTKVVLYKWNRKYQADRFFRIDLKKSGFKLLSREDFKGSSHDRITEEIYIK